MVKRTRKQQGGNGTAPPSAWGSVFNTYGNGWTQFMNALTLQPGANAGSMGSNDLRPIGNVNANDPNSSLLKQTGGRKRAKTQRKGKRGGSLAIGAVLEQAIVPFGLLAMQNKYGKSKRTKSSSNKRSRRSRR